MPQPVHVAAATQGEMPVVLTALGTVTPLANVTVLPQLSGVLQDVYFKEGQMVKKGDVLAQIDPRPYQISLENAQGTLVRDEALLQTARLDLKRYQTLLAQDSIASQQVDTQASLVRQYEGTVKSDKANIDTFKLDLVVRAHHRAGVGTRRPAPGRPGQLRDAEPDQRPRRDHAVAADQRDLHHLGRQSAADHPADADRRASCRSPRTTAATPRRSKPACSKRWTTRSTPPPARSSCARSSRTPSNMLFPNQFVNTRLLVDTIKDAVIVPTPAVLNGSMGQFVYVVKPDNTVTVRPVKVGPVDGERTSIKSGLQVGERVVIDGSDRLKEGAKITIPAEQPRGASGAHGRERRGRRIGRVAAPTRIMANTRRKPRNKGTALTA